MPSSKRRKPSHIDSPTDGRLHATAVRVLERHADGRPRTLELVSDDELVALAQGEREGEHVIIYASKALTEPRN
jgi:hypothetical protein